MKFKFIQKWLTLTSLTVILAAPVAAQDSGSGDLRKQVLALQQELSRLKAQGSAADRLQELERRIDLVAAEIEKMRTGGAVEAGAPPPPGRLAPAPAPGFPTPPRGPIRGDPPGAP